MGVSKTLVGFLLDTNVFNDLVDGNISVDQLPTEASIFVTPMQRIEIERIPETSESSAERKRRILGHLEDLPDGVLPTHTSVLGVTPLGGSRIGTGGTYVKVFNYLKSKKKNPKRLNSHKADALTAEVAIEVGLELITHDKALKAIVVQLGGHVLDLVEPALRKKK